MTSATTAAAAGRRSAQVPHHTLSLWNNYQVHPRVAAAVLVSSTARDMFATIDNTVGCRATRGWTSAGFYRLTPSSAPAGECRKPLRQEVFHQRRQQHQHFTRLSAHDSLRPDNDLLD